MRNISKAEKLRLLLAEFKPETDPIPRGLALYSAAVAIADEATLAIAARFTESLGATPKQIYEVVLQSYLFLGFPKMLTAAESFRAVFPNYKSEQEDFANQFEDWSERGTKLCKRVYSNNYEKLKNKVISFAPEIFDWMILEGYGKVLSRDALDIKIRELAVVSCLMLEKRPKQLHSHMQGALNVGVTEELLRNVIDDVGRIDEEGRLMATELMNRTRTNV